MSTKEIREDLVKRLRYWQEVERKSVAAANGAMATTRHPLLRLVMEIIRRDSELHERVQQFIIEAVEARPVTLAPEDMEEVGALLARHKAHEDQMVEAVQAGLGRIRGHKMLVEEYLLDYLVADETKHASLLQSLDRVKQGIYPYA